MNSHVIGSKGIPKERNLNFHKSSENLQDRSQDGWMDGCEGRGRVIFSKIYFFSSQSIYMGRGQFFSDNFFNLMLSTHKKNIYFRLKLQNKI